MSHREVVTRAVGLSHYKELSESMTNTQMCWTVCGKLLRFIRAVCHVFKCYKYMELINYKIS